MKEKRTIRKINQGDIHAFEMLFRMYYGKLCHWASKYLHDMDSSEEVVQELFYRLWRDRKDLNITVSVKSYLYTAVTNNCLMIIKKQKRRSSIELDIASRSERSESQTPVEVEEIKEVVKKTLAQLPERPATIFKMSRYEGLKYREIAERLSISIKTVEANMGTALEMFRKNLQEYI